MNVPSEQSYRRLYRALTFTGGALTLAVLALMMIEDSSWREWQTFQRAFSLIKADSATPPIARGVQQITIPGLATTERCISCHLGVEDPLLREAPLPFTAHSGDALVRHSAGKFGCTLCHRGNGRDLRVQTVCNRGDAYSDNEEALRYVGASCFRCHGTLFGRSSPVSSLPETETGRSMIRSLGCLGCHKIRGIGGVLGPDLTNQGEHSRSHYRFRDLKGELTIPNWLREHFQDPPRISPGSSMFPYELGKDSLDAMVTVLLGLQSPNLPLEYYSMESIQELKGHRESLEGTQVYATFCSGCHGPAGQGRPYLVESFGVPRLAGREFQLIASREMIEFLVATGRSSRPMPSWSPNLSGLTDQELQGLISEVRSWKPVAPPWEAVERVSGQGRRGRELYDQQCAMCHGHDGMGGIGPALNNQDFLSAASNRFLYQTIVTGRRNTAMPSWSYLQATDIADLLQLLRSWQQETARVRPMRTGKGDVVAGSRLFASVCSRCHGSSGEGGIGPAILNPDFLDAASDAFVLLTLERGRQHSPMFAVGSETRDGSLNLLSFMRSMRDSVPDVIQPGASLGQPKRGQTLYDEFCSDCHGKNGEGRMAPALNNQEFLNAATNGYLLATISLGRSGTPMPAWGRSADSRRMLVTSERQDIVAFIRIWQMSIIRRP